MILESLEEEITYGQRVSWTSIIMNGIERMKIFHAIVTHFVEEREKSFSKNSGNKLNNQCYDMRMIFTFLHPSIMITKYDSNPIEKMNCSNLWILLYSRRFWKVHAVQFLKDIECRYVLYFSVTFIMK